jgi:glyoxylase-like metal-dependent hydrolase (beta-lactamase superfamily II)
MAEPKTVAKRVEEVVPGLFHYQIEDERIRHISDGYALVADGSVTLIDPLPVEEAALRPFGMIAAVVIGAASHQRSAWSLRARSGAKVHAPAGAQGLDEAPDVEYKEGALLPGGLKAVPAPGPKAPHFALHLDRDPGVLFVGDLLMNEPGRGLVFLPDKYMQDPAAGPKTARRLLDLDFDVLCCAHGVPLTRGARKAIEDLLKKRGA